MSTFKQTQYAFAAHIRDPDRYPAPAGIEDRRMKIYRELFFNNVEGFISNGFPVLKSVLSQQTWAAMAREFFSRHHCHSPIFLHIAKEFLTFLESEREPLACDPAFLFDLAHYEWVELALSIEQDPSDYSCIDPNGDLITGVPVLSPVAWPLAYDYPVHKICVDFQPGTEQKEATFLVVYRNRNDKVEFMQINAVTARLLELVQENKSKFTGADLLEQLVEELVQISPEVIKTAGAKILDDLHASGILLGIIKN